MNNTEYPQAVICVANEGNEVSLQLWKIYQALRDDDARSEGLLRVVDESGEDYLFPEENFAAIDLPKEVKKPFERSVRQQRRAATATYTSASIKRVRVSSRTHSEKRSTGRGA